ncbi:hypothetical protein [Nocardioides terrisoli]|uniref:hypothetical protein n=1 Tax=Nocardioides terrisoli TaxID=3388267 RepID=UPI00287BAB70|nr:hypothetical protein [Nocardioides marmorisolisilvae]
MITHPSRTFARSAALAVTVALPFVAAPAFAEPPAAWGSEPHVSGLDFLVVLLLIPAGLALVITLLVMLPSLVKGDSYRPGEAWHGMPEWFGGPRKGTDAALPAKEDQGQGGAGATF